MLGILLICGQPAHVLIDSSFTHSFMSYLFAQYLHTSPIPLDCELKQVVFHSFDHSGLVFEGIGVVPPPYLISSMQACRLIQKENREFLCSVIDTQFSPLSLEDIHVIQ